MGRKVTRRGFLQAAGLTGAALLGACKGRPRPPPGPPPLQNPAAVAPLEPRPIPTRPLGRTGVQVPILALGGMFDTRSSQLHLRQTLAWGVSYWDTADCYENGNSEEGFGRYFERSPDERKKVFLVTKSDDRDPEGMSRLLEQSLGRLKTSHIDLYLLHGLSDPDDLTPEVREWAARMKQAGRIRLFGFSTHKNMDELLEAAASLGWIDAVMSAVNYRLLNDGAMLDGLEACRKAGVGVVGMKFRGGGPIPSDPDDEERLAASILARGFSPDQAMLKVLWEHSAIASVCASMNDHGTLKEYVAAALDTVPLAGGDREALLRHAEATRGTFCRACCACEAVSGGAPVADAMRSLMYESAYGDLHRAREAFAALPSDARQRLARADWSAAEGACPQGLPIGRLVADACLRLDSGAWRV